ncbi:MAG: hypothetical protein IJB83_03135 [Bacilli bacterium]|nr:hypothetical protein [Bacilli bacterium]
MKYYFKSKSKKYLLTIFIFITLCIILSVIYFFFVSLDIKYNHENISTTLMESKANYLTGDNSLIALYVDDKSVSSLDDDKSYVLVNYSCTNNEVVTYDWDTKILYIEPINKATNCLLYFNEIKNMTLFDRILADNSGGMSDENIDFAQISSDTNGNGLYYTSDLSLTEDLNNDGAGERVYYYRGAVTNNNVLFGGFCWRIVRTNEDGSVRLRYNGTYENGTCPVNGTNVKINNTMYKFYNSSIDNKYNEYIWEDGTGESIAKSTVDAWYTSSGLEDYEDQIANVPYCADKSNVIENDPFLYYGATNRFLNYSGGGFSLKNNPKPSYICNDIEDKHTVENDNWGGNGKLSKPIGLLTADEVVFAGGTKGLDNNSFYLCTNESYWTMSPSYWEDSPIGSTLFILSSNGSLIYVGSFFSYAILPVISLKHNVIADASSTGSYTNPYRIVN